MLPALQIGRENGMNIHLCSQIIPQECSEKKITQDSAMGWSLLFTLDWEMDSKLQWEKSWGLFMPCGSPSWIILATRIQKALFCSKEAGEIFEKGKFRPTVLVLVAGTVHNAGLCADSKEKNICVYLNGKGKEMLCQLTRS